MAFSITPEDVDLESMTKAELVQFAEDNNIPGLSTSMLKADLITDIKGAMGWT